MQRAVAVLARQPKELDVHAMFFCPRQEELQHRQTAGLRCRLARCEGPVKRRQRSPPRPGGCRLRVQQAC